MAVGQQTLHQHDGTLLGRTAANEYGQQLGFGKRLDAAVHGFFARTVLGGPLADAQALCLSILLHKTVRNAAPRRQESCGYL